ncbi:hypothetical protein PanWU01x14_039320 [Parasponia andersonii]|uniref:Uncharacterized protein n=1 Tax=Parasponia andersonii TaxID=3476 RepID=A0A2P5DQV3_PARAD|nr:hypothetical protein PanWU01x14_039320 [Parasponia andersonii]
MLDVINKKIRSRIGNIRQMTKRWDPRGTKFDSYNFFCKFILARKKVRTCHYEELALVVFQLAAFGSV